MGEACDGAQDTPPLPAVLAGTRCLGYLDENHFWHPGFSCPAFTFCCGTCHHRFCCSDPNLLISQWRQKCCLGLRWACPPRPPSTLLQGAQPYAHPALGAPHSEQSPGLSLGDKAKTGKAC